ncbi:phospholipase effector Tle1 domain-containing protein [Janthinobacterium agaricidamnosum]|uniref:T6SS Phospholipase effector Tle1-like catalytic domain-containing protein n=2 Tax=Janthinobacterium agaricidamnosum TaxID=55508 RepID=W0VC48_9BURK|nr:DUF2235 domain-containing protein [Janthinobacterium agaricidamnosum]CDG84882.1 putative uncharacterized protein [Janthinobacterium agaricidamnosum NBRC 102515 = DSM 9628]
MISKTPISAPFPVDNFLLPSIKEQSKISMITCDKSSDTKCSIPIRVGLFFDGTNNNLERDRDGKRIGVPDSKTKIPVFIKNKPLKLEEYSHSNVARLFFAFAQNKEGSGYFRNYMAGVGTPFPEIGELTESDDGKAFAKGGQPRIIWALLQVLNAIHLTADGLKTPLYKPEEIGKYAQDYDEEVGKSDGDVYGNRQQITHVSWFAKHIAKLEKARETRPKPLIPSVTLDVFGFSRGAAQAVAFCHLFNDLLVENKLAGIPATINFLGLFDTVATVGVSASVARTLPVPDGFADGHFSWAKRILDPLPACVNKGLHCIAAHEQRMNFPVTGLATGNKIIEMYFPGVHSDVGGGYAPGEQGKGRGAQAAMLSQIPLAYMYKAARLQGVPLQPFSELETRLQDEFQVDLNLASAWNAYTKALDDEGGLLLKHMELYLRWRAARMESLEQIASFKAADPQAQQDLQDSNRMLAGDVRAMKFRSKLNSMSKDMNSLPFSQADAVNISQWQYLRAQKSVPLNKWEQWALSAYNTAEALPDDVMRFFDDYVHDSLAGFYLAGEVTEYDKRAKASKVMKENPGTLKGFDKKVFDITSKAQVAQKKKERGEILNQEEENLANEAEYGTPYPIMTDTDSADLRNAMILTQTSTRREGGGYFMRRGYYPHEGFLFFRRSKYENQLQRTPRVPKTSKADKKDSPVFDMVWSEDMATDLRIADARQFNGYGANLAIV